MEPIVPNLFTTMLISGLAALACVLFMGGIFTLLYFLFFRSLIRAWFQERSRHAVPQLTEERIIEIVRKEIRDERIRTQ